MTLPYLGFNGWTVRTPVIQKAIYLRSADIDFSNDPYINGTCFSITILNSLRLDKRRGLAFHSTTPDGIQQCGSNNIYRRTLYGFPNVRLRSNLNLTFTLKMDDLHYGGLEFCPHKAQTHTHTHTNRPYGCLKVCWTRFYHKAGL